VKGSLICERENPQTPLQDYKFPFNQLLIENIYTQFLLSFLTAHLAFFWPDFGVHPDRLETPYQNALKKKILSESHGQIDL
jgi:hypothetical protein